MDNNAVCLIDADPLVYAMAFIGQEEVEQPDGTTKIVTRPFSYIEPNLVRQIDKICEACGSAVPPYLFLSGDDNFRDELATVKEYKGNRSQPRPFHYANVRTFIRSRYNTYISKGCEADDLLAMSMTEYRKKDIPCIVCTIDKDLLQVPGWHYRWETHNSGEVKPHFVDEIGHIEGKYIDGISEKTGKPTRKFDPQSLKGSGYKWFITQTLVGDQIDNIPGLPRYGAAKAYEALKDCLTKQECLDVAIDAYQQKYLDDWEKYFTEQARLVFMIRERDKNSPDGLRHWDLEYEVNKDAKEAPED